jgi:predicted NodU family carbamoyl transferase
MTAPLILGINAYHADAAACIVHDGRLLAAAVEERFRRIKHWAGLKRRLGKGFYRHYSIQSVGS